MTVPSITPSQVRISLLLRDEIALLDLRHEAAFATGHPLFAANMAVGRITIEAEVGCRARTCRSLLYDDGEGLVAAGGGSARGSGLQQRPSARWRAGGLARRRAMSCSRTSIPIPRPLASWSSSRRHTPSFPADEVAALIEDNANIAILDVRRFDEYATMNIPGSVSVPGAELVLRAGRGRARSQHHHHRQLRRAHPLDHRHAVADQRRRAEQGGALRNGTIGWTLAGNARPRR